MSEYTIYVRATRAEVRRAVAQLPAAAAGGGGDTRAIADAMMARCGMAALGRIKQAFIVKARGGADESGLKWKPLSPATIAYSRRHPGVPKQKSRGGTRSRADAPSWMLTQRQTARWWEVYRRQLARFRGDKGAAARNAWAVLKREGAQTLIGRYGSLTVDILRDTGLLLNSLSPGVQSGEQVFRASPGEVIVGTNRKWAGVHHNGSRDGRIPQRRLWPEPGKWPASWWVDINEQARAGLIDLTIFLIKRSTGT